MTRGIPSPELLAPFPSPDDKARFLRLLESEPEEKPIEWAPFPKMEDQS